MGVTVSGNAHGAVDPRLRATVGEASVGWLQRPRKWPLEAEPETSGSRRAAACAERYVTPPVIELSYHRLVSDILSPRERRALFATGCELACRILSDVFAHGAHRGDRADDHTDRVGALAGLGAIPFEEGIAESDTDLPGGRGGELEWVNGVEVVSTRQYIGHATGRRAAASRQDVAALQGGVDGGQFVAGLRNARNQHITHVAERRGERPGLADRGIAVAHSLDLAQNLGMDGFDGRPSAGEVPVRVGGTTVAEQGVVVVGPTGRRSVRAVRGWCRWAVARAGPGTRPVV